MADEDKRLAELEYVMRQMTDHFWRFQGRINALELVSTLEVFNMAKMQPNPFQWLQDYVEAMRVTLRSIKKPDVDDPAEGERLLVETRTSLEEFLERLVSRAGELKGAPGNPKK